MLSQPEPHSSCIFLVTRNMQKFKMYNFLPTKCRNMPRHSRYTLMKICYLLICIKNHKVTLLHKYFQIQTQSSQNQNLYSTIFSSMAKPPHIFVWHVHELCFSQQILYLAPSHCLCWLCCTKSLWQQAAFLLIIVVPFLFLEQCFQLCLSDKIGCNFRYR